MDINEDIIKKKKRVKEGKLAADSVQFSINTKEDSGNELELMVQEDGQKDYEIVARYPVRADMTFASVFSFDL